MTPITQITQMSLVLPLCLVLAVAAEAQSILVETIERHGIELPGNSFEAAFDAGMVPTVPVTPGSLATPLAMLSVATGTDRVAAAYAFGILAGRSARPASPAELAAAGQALLQMIASEDRRSRIAGARVAGRVMAASFDPRGVRPPVPAGMTDGLFALLNRPSEIEQLAAIDALGLMRETQAVAALTERYYFYRERGTRALAGGALEALARIGDASTIEVVRLVAADKWAGGRDATALAVAFARERLLKDGSVVTIQQAVDDKSRRVQARSYLDELGVPVP
ncbi:MAG: hypothetical protein EXQ50_09295 [Acidobacteria bacterium]|nr:hypothetical protein [Acidobacteriota bacterium]